jgi:hypothetical protein
MVTLPYSFPSDAFDNGLVSMPWFDLMDELEEILCATQWEQAKDVNFLQNALFMQIGATFVLDDLTQEVAQEAGRGDSIQ